ncbi:MAG: recombinase family protein, partial [Pirellulaceae bacterium]|nr:recombinase family protein [Pirellulaceae bacterium]
PTLSAGLIDAAENTPTSSSYRSRFGSLLQAYRLAGYQPDRDYDYIAINHKMHEMYPALVGDVIARLGSVGASVTQDSDSDLLLINGEYSASMVLSRCRQTKAGSFRWLVNIEQAVAPDITILVRMDAQNESASDYYLLPIMDISTPRLMLCDSNGAHLDTYQFDSLEYFTTLAKRQRIEVAA